MITVSEIDELRSRLDNWRADGESVGFVPTMGALHDGHLALVEHALKRSDNVVVSIFVNPTQFGEDEDLDSYPRDLERDAELLERVGCHLLFVPQQTTIYEPNESTRVVVGGPAEGLEGKFRPGHFDGVATVVTKLFNLVQPDLAVFGQKDAQQLAVIQQLVRDLYLPIDILKHPTVREDDGLALSSRNSYLNMEQRRAACALYSALRAAEKLILKGERSSDRLREAMATVIATEPLVVLEYAEVVDPVTFQPIDEIDGFVVLPIAASIGGTRLIDNIQIDPDRVG